MTIRVDSIRSVDAEKQLVSFTLTMDDVDYLWNANTPILSNEELLAWLEGREQHYCFSTLHQIYPDSKAGGYEYYLDESEDELAAMEEWIRDGCMLRDPETGEYTDKVEKVPWKGTHPPKTEPLDREKISEATRQQHEDAMVFEEIAKANNNGEMIEVLFAHIKVLNDIVFGRD